MVIFVHLRTAISFLYKGLGIQMRFIVSANTDVGIEKSINQDSMLVKIIRTGRGRVVLAVVCDGMGGLNRGELASASVIHAFNNWSNTELPALCSHGFDETVLREHWNRLVNEQNMLLRSYGDRNGVRLGTTIAALLLTESMYYILCVGDSSVYKISDKTQKLTVDQTLAIKEVMLGHITEEQAKTDERRNVLLQCIGAYDTVEPEMICGTAAEDTVFMLCSDGFRHEIDEDEMFEKFSPKVLVNEKIMKSNAQELIGLAKLRKERDNISVVLIRSVGEA